MMSRLRVFAVIFAFVLTLKAAPEELKLEEVLGLVRTNLTDLSEAELSNAAALGLIQQLGSKVQLVSTNAAAEPGASNTVARANVYGQHFAYFRVTGVAGSLADDLEKAWHNLAASNRLKGAIVDLRYARGGDYQTAARTADLWVKNEQSLLRAGAEEFRSSKSANDINAPLAVLINRQTSGAAEALAASLRQAGAALLIGGNTAGEARLFETFTLSTGQKLRIGTLPVEVGGKAIPANGITPDIQVNISSLDERAYYQDPFLVLPRGLGANGGTNDLVSASSRARRFNEAELVRRHREGLDVNGLSEEGTGEPNRTVIMDPALARAVDFLKGLAALRPPSAE